MGGNRFNPMSGRKQLGALAFVTLERRMDMNKLILLAGAGMMLAIGAPADASPRRVAAPRST